MRWLYILLITLMLSPGAARAAENADRGQGPELMHQKSDKGSFLLDLSLPAGGLKGGPNAVDLTVRDAAGAGVAGAEITVVPWMPIHGHGVWEKPVVKERGAGSYRVENVAIIMGGSGS